MTAYVVEVNEGKVEASRQGIDWWILYRHHADQAGRIVETKPACIVGGVVEVACDDQADAAWLADSMVQQHGMPASAVRVKKPTARPAPADHTGGQP